MKFAILMRHIGPYHHARLEALSRQPVDVSVFVYGDMQGVAYESHSGTRSYCCFPPGGDCKGKFTSLVDFLNTEQPEVVVLPGWAEPEALCGLQWALKNHVPTIVFSDSQEKDEPRTVWKETLKARIVRLFSAALVAGQNHIPYVVKLGIPVEKVFVGVDVVNNKYFREGAEKVRTNRALLTTSLGLPERFFLASNRLLPGKNVTGIVNAFAIYRQAGAPGDWGLVLLGDGQERRAVEAQCAALEVANHVSLAGMQPYSDLPVYYGLASAFVHASFSDTWGLVVNEAMAAGLPVLVSNPCGCVPDLVKDGVNGFSFDPCNENELASHMVKMANGEYDREAMGKASLEIISRWTPETFAKNMLDAARAALAEPLPKANTLDRLLLEVLARKMQAAGQFS